VPDWKELLARGVIVDVAAQAELVPDVELVEVTDPEVVAAVVEAALVEAAVVEAVPVVAAVEEEEEDEQTLQVVVEMGALTPEGTV